MSDVRGPLRGLKPRRFYQKISRSMFHHQQRSLVLKWVVLAEVELLVSQPWQNHGRCLQRLKGLGWLNQQLQLEFWCYRILGGLCPAISPVAFCIVWLVYICLVVLSCDPPASFSFHCIPFRKFSVYRWAFQCIPHFQTHPMIRFDRILCHWDGYWRTIHWTSPW